ncbi:hypothetical protein HSBAA_52700 [Vreelandella sulfidaeris]|uniref:YecA family protein n=1 Tax=Vreelandella sulfidaeris TaxID=115553 RepID=A0A455UM13_9GAMM|nr:hypothetical protein HSBAA_52700 [Halomonas sulfidaeris]
MAERSDTPETNTPPQPLLDDEQLDRLDDFLDSDQVDEDALDLISAHGFLVALAVAPSEVSPLSGWLNCSRVSLAMLTMPSVMKLSPYSPYCVTMRCRYWNKVAYRSFLLS